MVILSRDVTVVLAYCIGLREQVAKAWGEPATRTRSRRGFGYSDVPPPFNSRPVRRDHAHRAISVLPAQNPLLAAIVSAQPDTMMAEIESCENKKAREAQLRLLSPAPLTMDERWDGLNMAYSDRCFRPRFLPLNPPRHRRAAKPSAFYMHCAVYACMSPSYAA